MSKSIGTNAPKSKDGDEKTEKFDLGLRENNIATRLKLVLLTMTKDRGRYNWLEGQTGVPSTTWRMWWTRGGVPSGSLLEAAAKLWPFYAYWLLTGKTDMRCGHDMPDISGTSAQGYISAWPERSYSRTEEVRNGYSREYLSIAMHMTGETKSHDQGISGVKEEMNTELLLIAAARRKAEISKNFDVKLAAEDLENLKQQLL